MTTRTLSVQGALLVISAFVSAAYAQNRQPPGGEVFSSGSAQPGLANLGRDPGVCGDDARIARHEAATNTVARLFGYAAQGTREGQLGRLLEQNGFVEHPGACLKAPGIVMFLYRSKLDDAVRIGDVFAASGGGSDPTPAPGGGTQGPGGDVYSGGASDSGGRPNDGIIAQLPPPPPGPKVSRPPPTPAPQPCPTSIAVAHVDEKPIHVAQWFSKGGRTGGAVVSVMKVLPGGGALKGASVTEVVAPMATPNTCALPNSVIAGVCGTGGHATFSIGLAARRRVSVELPGSKVLVPVNLKDDDNLDDVFVDAHALFDSSGKSGSKAVDLMSTYGGSNATCQIACSQFYFCGPKKYGPFTITYTLTREVWPPLIGSTSVTRVKIDKR